MTAQTQTTNGVWPAWRCPVDGTPLREQGQSWVCGQCQQVYPEYQGVLRFVPKSNYADHFGLQWNRYRKTQLDSHTGVPITRERMERCLGPEIWARLRGLQVLEAGCGAGRFTEVLLGQGAQVTSVDLSNAVEANQENFPVGEQHRIAQADIMKLPFAPAQFDVVICLGVIQHTPVPEETIAKLAEHVKPGGWLVIDHYTIEPTWYTKSAPLFRMVLKRLPPRTSMAFTEWLVNTFLPLQRWTGQYWFTRAIFWRICPIWCYYHLYPALSDELQKQWALLDTHDVLTDWFKHRRSPESIQQTLVRLGLQSIRSVKGGIGVEARAQKPIK